jgi:hypothetical protein
VQVVSSHSDILAPLAVDAVLAVTADIKNSTWVDLDDIRIVKKLVGPFYFSSFLPPSLCGIPVVGWIWYLPGFYLSGWHYR